MTNFSSPMGLGARCFPTREQTQTTSIADARAYRLDNLTSPRIREARTGYYPIELGRPYLPAATGRMEDESGGDAAVDC